MTGRAPLLASAFVAALAALPAGKAGAASLLEKNFYLSGPQYEGKLPPCDYRDALTMIASRFNQKENMYWATDLRIVNFERIRETAFRPWAANAIPRRFCSGVVEVTDGRKHAIHYSISEDTGMIGASWGIEWCVVGLDRNWSYNPACKMAQPSVVSWGVARGRVHTRSDGNCFYFRFVLEMFSRLVISSPVLLRYGGVHD